MKTYKDIARRLKIKSIFLFILGGCFILTSIIGLVFFGNDKTKSVDVKPNDTTLVIKSDTPETVIIIPPQPIVDTPKPTKTIDSPKHKVVDNPVANVKTVELEKVKDTFQNRRILINLLSRSKKNYDDYVYRKTYDPRYADSLFSLNSQMKSLLNDKSSFFSNAITHSEADTLENYFDRWIIGYNQWKNKAVDKREKRYSYDGSQLPKRIIDKINRAYDKYK